MATPAFGVNPDPNTWLTLNGQPLSFERNNENLEANAHEFDHSDYGNLIRITNAAPDDLRISVDDAELQTERYGSWYWRAKAFAGLYQLEVSAPGYPLYTALVRVVPSKLNYARYQQMLTDISQVALDLLFYLSSPASEKLVVNSRESSSSALREYTLVAEIIKEMEGVIAQIRREPHRTLAEHSEQRFLHEVNQFSAEVRPMPGPAVKIPAGVAATVSRQKTLAYLPEIWITTQKSLTYDVYENRLLKHFVQHQLTAKLGVIQDVAKAEIKRRRENLVIIRQRGWDDDETPQIEKLEDIIADCGLLAKRTQLWASEAFLKDVKKPTIVSKPSQILQKNPNYSRFYRQYLRFQQELKISYDTDTYLTTLALRKMSDLYEMWAVFRVTRVVIFLLEDFGFRLVSNSGFFEIDENRFQFEVKKNLASIELEKGNLRVKIKYEPIYNSSFNAGNNQIVARAKYERKPDLAIEVWSGSRAVKVIIFDPKYKDEKVGDTYTYLEKDLNKMREYRDVICWKSANNPRPQPIVSSAYILYPGTEPEHDPSYPEIGAIPLVPDLAPNEEAFLYEAIEDTLNKAGLI